MVLRLLSKREVDSLKQQEKQKEIDEGLKLAKRIDALREVKAQEEKSLEDFRQKRIAQIHAEIEEQEKSRLVLKAEVDALLREKREAEMPLYERETSIAQKEKELAQEQEELEEQKRAFIRDKDEFFAEKKMLKEEAHRIAGQKRQTEQTLISADDARTEAKKTLADARKLKKEILIYQQNSAYRARERERALDIKKKALDDRERALHEGIKELHIGQKRLKDREAKLERNIKRTQK